MYNPTPHQCLIVGAGIGGLTAAIALAQNGIAVEVLERSEQLEKIGAGIQLSPNCMHVFDRLGLKNAIIDAAFEPINISLRQYHTDQTLLTIPIRTLATKRYEQPYLLVHRTDLIHILYQVAIQHGVNINFNQALHEIGNTPHQVHAHSARESFNADMLIGADGIKSTVREQLFGPQNPRFTGQVAWRGVIDAAHVDDALLSSDAHCWLGPGGHFIAYRVRAGRLINFVAVQECASWSHESWRQRSDVHELKAAFSSWHHKIKSIINACQQCYLWGLFDREPLTNWYHNQTVLIGDACHPMLPFMAQGAAMAVEDAYVLAQCLRQHNDRFEEAFKVYQKARLPRTRQMQKRSRRNARLYHLKHPIPKAIRQAQFALANRLPVLIHSQLDPVFDHNVTGRDTTHQL